MIKTDDVSSGAPAAIAGDQEAVLRIEELHKSYGSTVAVTDTSLSVRYGEFVTLLGPSGSGKTTTLLAVAGFVLPDRGSIVLDGRDVSRVPPHRRDIGVVFQNYALFPHLTVRKNVAFPLAMRGIKGAEAQRRVEEILDVVELGQLADRYPKQLSGGQQQRVALARALVFSPKLLLMDEPLGALDKRLRASLQYEIKRIARELGATVLYVTHDQEEAMAMSDRIAVYRDGRILQLGSPEDLYERPRSAFVAEFLGDSNLVRGTLEKHSQEHVLRAGDWHLPVGAASCQEVGLRPGDEAAVAIRPERIALTGGGGDGVGSGTTDRVEIPGLVREVVYLGACDRAVVSTPVGELIVQVPIAGDRRRSAGDSVAVSWRTRHGVVVAT